MIQDSTLPLQGGVDSIPGWGIRFCMPNGMRGEKKKKKKIKNIICMDRKCKLALVALGAMIGSKCKRSIEECTLNPDPQDSRRLRSLN